MRFLLPLSLSLFLCVVAQAQNETAPEPKDFQFDFDTSTNQKDGKAVTQSQFGFSRMLPTGNAIVFDKAVSGIGGFLKTEDVTFLDKNGVELAKISSAFQADGKLKSQTFTPKGKPVRTLTWYKTQAQSPDIQVPNSVVRVRYSLLKGFLKQRVVIFNLPADTRQFTTSYDAQGRRVQDSTKEKNGERKMSYSYGAQGMVRFAATAEKEEGREATLSYLQNGAFDGLVFKSGGVLQSRMKMTYAPDGKLLGQRLESYEEGVLNSSLVQDIHTKTRTQDEYDPTGKYITRRIGFLMDLKNTVVYEEIWKDGKRWGRHDIDANGNVTKETFYNPDGTIIPAEKVKAEAAPATP